jgi:hypothetical protein
MEKEKRKLKWIQINSTSHKTKITWNIQFLKVIRRLSLLDE